MNRVYIKTYGCQMNVYDSERMIEALAPSGYVPVDDAEAADLILLNTCHIREKAAEKVYSELGQIKRLKAAKAAEGGSMLVAVAGCVAQAEGAEAHEAHEDQAHDDDVVEAEIVDEDKPAEQEGGAA